MATENEGHTIKTRPTLLTPAEMPEGSFFLSSNGQAIIRVDSWSEETVGLSAWPAAGGLAGVQEAPEEQMQKVKATVFGSEIAKIEMSGEVPPAPAAAPSGLLGGLGGDAVPDPTPPMAGDFVAPTPAEPAATDPEPAPDPAATVPDPAPDPAAPTVPDPAATVPDPAATEGTSLLPPYDGQAGTKAAWVYEQLSSGGPTVEIDTLAAAAVEEQIWEDLESARSGVRNAVHSLRKAKRPVGVDGDHVTVLLPEPADEPAGEPSEPAASPPGPAEAPPALGAEIQATGGIHSVIARAVALSYLRILVSSAANVAQGMDQTLIPGVADQLQAASAALTLMPPE